MLLINLAKGKIGDDSANVLGGLFVTALGLAAYSRADIPEEQRRPFFIYIDEFQNFTTLSIAQHALRTPEISCRHGARPPDIRISLIPIFNMPFSAMSAR